MKYQKIAKSLGLPEATLKEMVMEEHEFFKLLTSKERTAYRKVTIEFQPRIWSLIQKTSRALKISEQAVINVLARKGLEKVIAQESKPFR